MVLYAGGNVVEVEPDNIPGTLKAERRWCVWQRVATKGGKFTKKPMQAGNPRVGLSKTTPGQWQDFSTALSAYDGVPEIDGLGFVCGGGFVALDFDECCDEVTREITSSVAEIVARLDSYSEFSPSGRGVRVFVRGTLPGPNIVSKALGYELYSEGAYVTLTGQRVPGTPAELADGGDCLAELYESAERASAKPAKKPAGLPSPMGSYQPSELGDTELLEVAKASASGHKIGELLAGNVASYPTASEAELALCNHLAFYAGPSGHAQVERLLRSSGLMRGKFDEGRGEQSYIALTIAKAYQGRSEFYSGRPARQPAKPLTTFTNGQPSTGPACLSDSSTMTDIGLARRLMLESRGRLRYCREQKNWLSWSGSHWVTDDGLGAQHIAKTVSDLLWSELAELPEAMRSSAAVSFVKASSSCRAIDSACKLARSEPGVVVSAGELDRPMYLLNLANGTLNLETAELLPHEPERLLTHMAGVAFDTQANAPRFKRFIDEVTQGDVELGHFLQRSCGVALSADVSEHTLWVHYGAGGNGKGTLLSILMELLGTYAGPAPMDMLLIKSRSKEQETQFASLAGKRLVTSTETDEGVRLSEAVTKLLTGGDTVLARKLYQQAYPLVPSWHLHLACNHKPIVRGTDSGIWRRLKLIPWQAEFKNEGANLSLMDELRAELPGILNWCLVGFSEWRRAGLRAPASVSAASAEYRSQNDTLGQWLTDCCTTKPVGVVAESGELYQSYRLWTERRNDPTLTATAFGLSLERLGYKGSRATSGQHRHKTVRAGIGLLDSRQED